MTTATYDGMDAETVTTYFDELSIPEWTGGGDGFGAYVAGARYSVFGQPLLYDLGTSAASLLSYAYEAGTRRLDRTWLVREGAAGYDVDLAYTYDDAGNPTSVVDTPTVAGGQGDAQCFAYDGLRRLTSAWTPGDGDCGPAPTVQDLGGAAPYWMDYTFDAVGNRTGTVSHAAEGNTTATYTYPAPGTAGPHQLSQVVTTGPGGATTDTYTYDPAGNTTTRALDGEPAQTLTWDAEGELTAVTEDSEVVGEYLYTADGDRLVRRQDEVTTVYLPGGQELALDPVGTVTATRYYTFNGQTIATRADDGSVTTLVADPHATANLAIDNTTGAITHRYTDPYGNPRGATPAWPGDHGYLDRPTDTTGLVQLGARYYDPATGRFASVDPVMDLTDPQQWHGYSYANNNPNTYTDPSGLFAYYDRWGAGHYMAVYGPGSQATYAQYGTHHQRAVYEPGYVHRRPSVTNPPPPVVWSSPSAPAPARLLLEAAREVPDAFATRAETAARLSRQASLDLRRGLSEGGEVLRYFKGHPQLSKIADIGRNPLVRFGGRFLGPAGSVAGGFVDYYENYFERYSHIENEELRERLSRERALATGVTSLAVGIALDIASTAVCVGTGGLGCAQALVTAASMEWLASQSAGLIYDVTAPPFRSYGNSQPRRGRELIWL